MAEYVQTHNHDSDEETIFLPVDGQAPEHPYQYRYNLQLRGVRGNISKNLVRHNYMYYEAVPRVEDIHLASETEAANQSLPQQTYQETWV